MNRKLIYLDNNATTPTDPRVVEAMLPYFYEKPGNAASRNHPFGWVAEEAVDYAREQIAELIHVDAKEIIFTSGATEADNLGLKGIFEMYQSKGNHIITAKTEHKAILDSCKKIEKMGGQVTYLDVKSDGLVDLAELEAAINALEDGQVLLVENTRFEDVDGKKESKNDEELGKYLSLIHISEPTRPY